MNARTGATLNVTDSGVFFRKLIGHWQVQAGMRAEISLTLKKLVNRNYLQTFKVVD